MQKILSFFLSNKKFLPSIPRSIYYNVKIFGWKIGIRCPVFFANSTIVKIRRQGIVIHRNRISTGMIKIGYNQCDFFSNKQDKSILSVSGKIIFAGFATLGCGAHISVGEDAQLTLGNQFWSTGNILLIVRKEVEFGNNCVLSWNITIMDHDAHKIFDATGKHINPPSKIQIGNHVWIGHSTMIMKKSMVPDNCIVGAGSIITESAFNESSIILGHPAKMKRQNVSWQS